MSAGTRSRWGSLLLLGVALSLLTVPAWTPLSSHAGGLGRASPGGSGVSSALGQPTTRAQPSGGPAADSRPTSSASTRLPGGEADRLSEPDPVATGYDEVTYHLPGFDRLLGHLKNLNGLDEQIPTLSSDDGQPVGIYYVDNSSNLDDFNLSTQAVTTVAAITPLYATWGYNAMVDNEFTVTYGYDDALFFGTVTSAGPDFSLELVNLTSGTVASWLNAAPINSVNQQAIYVGNDTVVVLSSNDSIDAFDLATHTAWVAGALGFFEANNVYWMPQKEVLIDVEADGASGDDVEQLSAYCDVQGRIHFVGVETLRVDSSVPFNFVNGIGFNESADELAFAAGTFKDAKVTTYVLPFAPDGLLTLTGEARHPLYVGTVATNPTLFFGQQYVYTSDFVLGWYLDGQQYLYDPWDNATAATNHSFGNAPCPNACYEGSFGPSVDYLLDFNASVPGDLNASNIVYAHQNTSPAAPPFEPTPLPMTPPAPSGLTVESVGASWIDLGWRSSAAQGTRNNTVYVFAGSTCSSAPGTAWGTPEWGIGTGGPSSAAIVGSLASDTQYSLFITSWNATGQSPPSACVSATTGTWPTYGLAELVNLYENRPDLQGAFPEAASGNLSELAELTTWASEVVSGEISDTAFPELAAPDVGYYFALMGLYNERSDLRSAFPEAYTNGSEFARLLTWASEVAGGRIADSSNQTLAPWSYAYALLGVYEQRSDLVVAFPNALARVAEFESLIDWAGHVVNGSFVDSAESTLHPFGAVYELLTVYDERTDLRSAWPDANGSAPEFTGLVNWAGEVLNGTFADSSRSALTPFGYWAVLLWVYDGRSDLQSAFPNAFTNGTSWSQLLEWADGVVSQSFVDSAYTTLLPYASTYEQLG